MFICFEGCDGVGKTTQSINLFNLLKTKYKDNLPVLLTFPDRETLTGKLLNNYLTGKEKISNPRVSHLLFSANRWEKSNQITNFLKEDK